MARRCWKLGLLLLLQIFGHILLVVDQAGSSSPANKTIRLGYLLQSMDRAGAINVAIEQAQTDGLLRDYNFRYNFCFDSVNSATAYQDAMHSTPFVADYRLYR